MCADRFQKIRHLIRLKHRRRSPADKNRLDHARRRVLHRQFHLPVQRTQVIHDRLVLQDVGVEVTVEAFIGAERDMDVYGLRGTAIIQVCNSCLLCSISRTSIL
ncbi:hypothetical protein D3C75_1126280 [compost metagenome]